MRESLQRSEQKGVEEIGVGAPVPAKVQRSSWTRQLLSIFVSIFLAFVIFAEVNYLSNRHYQRFDVTASRRYSLSPKSIGYVQALDVPVRVKTTFVMDEDPHRMALELLTEYAQYSKNFILEDNLDLIFTQDLAERQKFAERYKFATINEAINKIVLDYGDGERFRVVKSEELMEFGAFNPRTGERGEGKFLGEEKISGALLDLIEARKTAIYFTVGHGEGDPNKAGGRGLSRWRRSLEIENYRIDTVHLLEGDGVPEEADLVVIAGPSDPLRPEEEDALAEYLEKGGRVLLLAGALSKPGLGGLLREWGVELRSDLIVVKGLISMTMIVVEQFRPHPITNPLEGRRLTIPLARSVDLLQPTPEGIEATVLFESPDHAWGETRYRRRGVPRLDPEDNEGPLPMAIAFERSGAEGDRPARLAVVGCNSFVENGEAFLGVPMGSYEDGSNSDLALNIVGWLAERERVVGIAPKRVDIRRVRFLEKGDQVTIYLFSLAVLPGIALIAGLSIWWLRRG